MKERNAMKTANKKFLVVFVLILALSVSFIPGCQSDHPTGVIKNPDSTAPDETETETKPLHYEAAYLPDADYDGYQFRIVTPTNGIWNLMTLEADVENMTGDIFIDAIYTRNRLIEEKYNIIIKSRTLSTLDACTSLFQKCSQSGSDDFDLLMMIPQSAWPQALAGNVVPVDRLPYLDITQPWYVQSVNDSLSIGGKHFFVYSDDCLNLLEISYCILFNKQLAADLGLGSLYDLVKEDKWTIDVLFDYARKATVDLDGDQKMTDTDQYGILGVAATVYPPLWQAAGITLVGKDEDDYHVFTGGTEKVFNVMEKIFQNLCGGQKIYFDGYYDNSRACLKTSSPCATLTKP